MNGTEQRDAPSDDLCPLCGQTLSEPLSDDHVFGDAFGATKKVVTHKACNNQVGGSAEGRMHRPDTVFNFIRALHGLNTEPLRGVMQDGREITFDPKTRTVLPRRPTVNVVPDPEARTTHLTGNGSEAQIRRLLRDWRKKYSSQIPRYEDLTQDQLEVIRIPVDEIMLRLNTHSAEAEQFAVKAALGAGVLAYGTEFAGTPLAVGLREWRDRPFIDPFDCNAQMAPQRIALGSLGATAQSLASVTRGLPGRPPLPPFESPPNARTYQALFVPDGLGQTCVFVQVLGMNVVPWGISVPEPLPKGRFGVPAAPVLVREIEDHADVDVTHYTDLIMEPVVRLGQRGAQSRTSG